MKTNELGLWTPLIGFDVEQKDKGAAEYLARVGCKPACICLFVNNADIVNYHVKGMPEEKVFPPDYCNYYGSPQNDLRKRQSWTNYDLRQLCGELSARGVETFMSIMGVHLSPESEDDDTPQVGMFGYVAKQDFIMEHRELAIESTLELGYVNLLKRFRDGSSFGDYFIQKAYEAVCDYGMTGLHLSDSIFPQSIQSQFGDFSDDMIEQFTAATKIRLPEKLLLPLKDPASPGIGARSDYIWNKYREQWLSFISSGWEKFFTKLCKVFHAGGKKVMVNNAWTCAPFEAYYRFAIDYKALERAGVDAVCIEDQATVLFMSDGGKYRIHELMNTPAVMKAYAPKIKHLAINYAKDSTEEGSIINHNPPADEREIYMLTSPLYIDENGADRVVDGFFVCLADSLSKQEWDWLQKRYAIAWRNEPACTLSATLVWSDRMMSAYVPEYIATRRMSTHKIVSELSRYGGKIGAVARIENLSRVSGLILVPNIDLISADELEAVANYPGPVVYTSMADKKTDIGETDIYFEDNSQPRAEYRMVVGGKNLGLIDYAYITAPLGEAGDRRPLYGEGRYVKDSPIWMTEFVYREPDRKFMRAAGRLVFTAAQDFIRAGDNDLITVYRLKNGMIRLVIENDDLHHYNPVKVHVNGYKIKKIINGNDFPVQPLKLLYKGDLIRPNTEGDRQLQFAVGFISKLPPGGCAFVDLILEKEGD